MAEMRYTYPARLYPQEDGSLVVRFLDLPEALTDGANEAEALVEASDCLSEALAGRIHRGEDIPPPSAVRPGLHGVAPDPAIALKAALHSALRNRRMSVSDLARRLDIDERRAARLVDPRVRSSLTGIEEALSALDHVITIEVHEKRIA